MDYKQVNDYEVMYMIGENDDDARELIFNKYLPLVSKIASKYSSYSKNLGVEFDDLLQEGMIALNKAIESFNDSNNTLFYTYVAICIERHIITYCNRSNNKKNYYLNYSVGEDAYSFIPDSKLSVDYFMNEYLSEEFFVYFKNLFGIKHSSVFELRYNGFTYKEISQLLDISIGTVDARMSKIRRSLQKKWQYFC